MKYSFDKTKSLIRIAAHVHGANEVRQVMMALDTGATRTCISPEILVQTEHSVDSPVEFATLTTGNGPVMVLSVAIHALRCLGQTKVDFPVHALAFPSSTGIVGLLGLDFLQDRRLCIDFRDGTVELL